MNRIIEEDTIQIIKDNPELLKMSNKTFMITGASGMIGSYFVETLLKLNEIYSTNINIVAVVRNPDKLSTEIRSNKNVEVLIHDVTDSFNYENKIDYIIHAASPASPAIMSKFPFETNLANTVGTANTLKLAIKNNVDGYLFVSSREIYGQPSVGQEFFEENGKYGEVDQLVPRNGYAEGKKAAENMCVGVHEEYGINTKIVRLAHTYGPGMSIYDGRVQADFLKNIMFGENIVMKSKGEAVRTYTYISDAVNAMFKILLNSSDIVYNIADENSKVSIKELAETLVSISPTKGTKLIIDIPKEDPNAKGNASFTLGILSTEKLRKELSWLPKYNVKDGFKRTMEYLAIEMKRQKIEEDQKKMIKSK